MQINDQTLTTYKTLPRITVIGLGGGGCNTINRLSSLRLPGIRLVAANTDALALNACSADERILLGLNLTRGLGSGGDAEVGQQAAEESFRELIGAIKGTDMLFLTAGMGGGTGSGAIQIAARIAKSLGVLTIAIVTTPFSFESGLRAHTAREATARLRQFVDTLITIPNDRLIGLTSRDTTLRNAFALADDLLIKGIQSISGMIHSSGLLNVDFSHILRLMRQVGGCYISTGVGSGADKASAALRSALRHPLLEEIPLQNAKGMVVKFSGTLSLAEIQDAMKYLKESVSPDAELITAMEEDNLLKNQVQVMVLVTGIGAIPVQEQSLS
ncbi:MAG: cell division protein FtsZ, partial [Kiritimatiellota bacterium]|nr:cell division protein FtsZ [Kiritimatiellota bacterium]